VPDRVDRTTYEDLVAQLESLAPEGAEAILAGLAAAIFPDGVSDIAQVSWERRDTPSDPPVPMSADAAELSTMQKLRAAELRYRTLVEQIPAVTFMAVLGEGANEVYVSPHIEALLGFSQKEWLENPFLWYTQLHPDDRALWHDEFARGCRTGGPFRAECRFLARDGRVVWVRGEARLVKDDLGRPLFLQGVAFDVTESRRAQAIVLRDAVSTTEQRYRDLVDRAGAVFWEAEIGKSGFTFVSRAAEQMLGFPAERWVAEPEFWISRVHPDDRAVVLEAKARTQTREAGTDEFEFRVLAADGRTLWVHQKVYVHRLASGERRVLGVLFDITSRKEAEEVLRVNATRLETEANVRRTLHRIGSELASELAIERVVQLATDEATALTSAQFGAFFYNVVDEKGESYTLYALSGVSREAFASFPMPRNTPVFAPTFTGTGIVRSDDITKDPRYGRAGPHFGMPKGHLPVRSYLAVPVISRTREVLGGLFFGHADAGVFTDEHEDLAIGIAGWAALAIDNARLYSAAESARQSAEAANRAKDEFLATMSHELRTPLNAVLGWTQILRSGAGTGETRERALATVDRNARAQAQIIDDLLDVSRIVTGKLTLEVGPVDLVGVIDASLEAVSLAVSSKQLTVAKTLDRAAAIVSGDAARLRQVVTNLLTNAVKFTPAGGRIEVRLDSHAGMARIQVADSGQGIDRALLPHVFDRFWQADSSTTRAHGGLGLGLAIVRHIAEMHGGRVAVDSAGIGHGATFTVELPLGDTVPLPQAQQTPEPAPVRQAGTLRNARVLVVDDEADSRELVVSLLAGAGADAAGVVSVADAVCAVQDRRPDLIVSDIGMPHADGYELLRQLRAMDESRAAIPVIALSAYAREEDRRRALQAGFQAHIGKPFDAQDLLGLAAALIASRRGR
jgi:PAS domain S-box-containing protein